MSLSSRLRNAAFAATLLVAASPAASASPDASPAPSSSPAPSPTAAAQRENARPAPGQVHRAIVTCLRAPFYVWPDRSSAPRGTAYPPARLADGFEVLGDGTLAYGGLTLYETTIDVVQPFGVGKHYWISADCVNAG